MSKSIPEQLDDCRKIIAKLNVAIAHSESAHAAEVQKLREEIERLQGWTCYHCGEHFVTHTHAKLHFGIAHTGAQPACLIKAEQGLVKYIRELELRLGKAMEEDSDTLRDMAEQRVEKANAVADAEELGYSRGLKDYIKIESKLCFAARILPGYAE